MNPSALIRRPAAAARLEAANDAGLTMSSREIAELVGSRHDSVKRAIERLAERCTIELPPLVEVANAGPGPAKLAEYRVGKRDSYVIVAQLSPEFTARLVDRWQELEDAAIAAPAFSVPTTLSEALRLAADQAEQIEQQQAQLARQAPQVAALHRIALAETDATLCLTDAAKHLQVAPRKLTAWMMAAGWLYRRTEGNNLTAVQKRLDSGYLTHKLVEYNGSGGEADVRQARQVRVTQKGLAKLAHLIEKGKGPA